MKGLLPRWLNCGLFYDGCCPLPLPRNKELFEKGRVERPAPVIVEDAPRVALGLSFSPENTTSDFFTALASFIKLLSESSPNRDLLVVKSRFFGFEYFLHLG